MSRRRTAQLHVCAYAQCQTVFPVQPARAKSGRGLFCCKDHWRLSQAEHHVIRPCAYPPCGKLITIPPNVLRNGRGTFCSKTCADLAKRLTLPLAERLWQHIHICSHGLDCPYCCWPWEGTRFRTGYGRLNIDGTDYTTSRLIWEVWHKQSMPADLDAAHYCNTPPCNNYHHIYPASPYQNHRDAVRAGTFPYGSRRKNAKLHEQDIPDIFALHAQGWTAVRIARLKDVSATAIRRVLRREGWQHVQS